MLEGLRDDPALARLAPLLSGLVAIDLPDSALTGAMTGEVRADNTRDLVARLLRGAVAPAPRDATDAGPAGPARPRVLVLEDAHWLDSASWALAREVAERVSPVLLVLATRPLSEPLPTDYLRLERRQGHAHAPAGRVGSARHRGVGRPAAGRGGAAGPDCAVLIVERAEGNPFYCEELALALRDAGVVTVGGGVCRLAPASGDLRDLAFPDTVQGVITSRIDRLTPRQQLTLKVASVIGRGFAHRLLRDVHPLEGDRPHLAAECACWSGASLTVQEAPEPELAYLFKHVLTQETAYSLLPFAERRELHRTVAGWIERREGSDLAPYYPLLAYHWGRAEDRAKTVDYLELAGEQALRQSAYQEAVGFLTEALRLDAAGEAGEDRSRRARWERQLGDAHLGLGHLTASREHVERALALQGRPAPTTRPGLVAGLAGQVLRQAVHRAWPARFVGRARQTSATDLEAARADDRLGRLQHYAQELLPAMHSTVRVLNRAEAAGPSPELALGYARFSYGAGVLSLRSLAEAYGCRARATARSVGDPAALSSALLATSLYDLGIGLWARAREALEEATENAERLGDARRVDECRSLLALVFLHQGEFARAARSACGPPCIGPATGRHADAGGRAGKAQRPCPRRGPARPGRRDRGRGGGPGGRSRRPVAGDPASDLHPGAARSGAHTPGSSHSPCMPPNRPRG